MLLPGSGDELQGIKRGVMELADLLLVNKADGELEAAAGRTVAEYQHALRLLQPRSKNWVVPVLACSAHAGHGIAETWEVVEQFCRQRRASGEFQARRASQARSGLWSETAEILLGELRTHAGIRDRIVALEAKVAACELPASVAAGELASAFLGHESSVADTSDCGPVTAQMRRR
jgi:LAO/AO transport system kinase